MLISFFCLFQLNLLAQDEEVIPIEEIPSSPLNFAVVEEVPVANGCQDLEGAAQNAYRKCMQQYIFNHIAATYRFPVEAQRKGVGAKVYVHFIIEKDGSVDSVEVVRSAKNQLTKPKHEQAAEALDAEAVRVIKLLKFESPARQKGKPVRMSFTVPINAHLS